MYQFASLPAPFPIRIPFGFRDNGKWGKIETQKARRVISDLRDDFFKKSLSLKIRFAEMRKGRSRTKPIVP